MRNDKPPVRVRAARAEDHAAVAALMPELGTPEPPLARERFEREFLGHCLVAARGDDVLGYAFFETLADSGYVRHLVVAPAARGSGLGRTLMGEVAERLRRRGASEWRLNVRPGNAPALALYRSLGMKTRYESTVLRFDWARVADLGHTEGPFRAATVVEADDARIEAAFALPAGQVARARTVGRVLTLLEDSSGAVAGYAAFDPGFPGAFPFRVSRASQARPLLEALRPNARAGEPRMQVVADGHPALVEALRSIDAEVRDVILHLAGDLPRG